MELPTLLFALKQAYQSLENKLTNFSDSLSACKHCGQLKTDYTLLIQIQDKLHKIDVDQKEIVFMWVPGHVGIWENWAAGRAAEEAFDKEPTDNLMPFSDLKPLTAKYRHQSCQKEWDEAVITSSKLHEIFPKLSDKLLPFGKTRKEDSSKQITYWSFLFGTFLYFEKRRASCLCCM